MAANANDAKKNANLHLKPGTLVVSTDDYEPGRVVDVVSRRRSGVGAWSYLVETAYGQEIWHAGDLFVPEVDENDAQR